MHAPAARPLPMTSTSSSSTTVPGASAAPRRPLPSLDMAPVHDYFAESVRDGTVWKTCLVCSKALKKAKDGSTSSMRTHMLVQHEEKEAKEMKEKEAQRAAAKRRKVDKTPGEVKSDARQTTILEGWGPAAASTTAKWKPTDPRYKRASRQLVEFIARDSMPLQMVDCTGFINYSLHLQPAFIPPGRTCITGMVGPEAQRVKGELLTQIRNATHISFTTDIWTETKSNRSFISLSSHWITESWTRRDYVLGCEEFGGSHTGAAIGAKVRSMLSEWSIAPSKWNMMVRDGAANMRNGCSRVMPSIHCTIHLLQLVVVKGCMDQRAVVSLLSKCASLISFLSHSPRGMDQFKRIQADKVGIPLSECLAFVKPVETRWNSSYLMLRRILHLKGSLTDYLSEDDQCRVDFSAHDWKLMKSVADVLVPFYRATVLLSSNKICSSQIALIILKVKTDLQRKKAHLVGSMRDELLDWLNKRFYSDAPSEAVQPVTVNILKDPRYTIPTLLNPRSRCLLQGEHQDEARRHLAEAMEEFDILNDDDGDQFPLTSTPAPATASGGF